MLPILQRGKPLTDWERRHRRDLNTEIIKWEFSVQCKFQYLQSFVRDVGLPTPSNRMIPVVGFAMQTPTDGPQAGHTTGNINPGIIWFGRYVQLGIEAVIPGEWHDGQEHRGGGAAPLLPRRHCAPDLHLDAIQRRAGSDTAHVEPCVGGGAALDGRLMVDHSVNAPPPDDGILRFVLRLHPRSP
jgi:hypothetical protein